MREILLNQELFEQMNGRFDKVFDNALEGSRLASQAERAQNRCQFFLADMATICLNRESEDIRYVMRNIIASFTETDNELSEIARRIGEEYVGPGIGGTVIVDDGITEINYDLPHSDEFIEVVSDLKDGEVDYREIKPYDKIPSEQEIIDHLAGADTTGGSCASQAFAYIANRAGYDVTDYRGGESTDIFSWNRTIEDIANYPGVTSKVINGTNDMECAHQLLAEMKPDREYFLGAGGHAAIVKYVDGEYRYLELQSGSPERNGWHTLDDDALRNRFVCSENRSGENQSQLIDIESLYDSNDFLITMGYINTNE